MASFQAKGEYIQAHIFELPHGRDSNVLHNQFLNSSPPMVKKGSNNYRGAADLVCSIYEIHFGNQESSLLPTTSSHPSNEQKTGCPLAAVSIACHCFQEACQVSIGSSRSASEKYASSSDRCLRGSCDHRIFRDLDNRRVTTQDPSRRGASAKRTLLKTLIPFSKQLYNRVIALRL
jgi:hypothetical protein